MLLYFDANELRQRMQGRDLIQSRFVKSPANEPTLVTIAVEILLPQIFDPDKSFHRIVKINFRYSNSVGVEKLRDVDVVPVFFAVERSEEHTSELQSQSNLVCRLLLEKKKRTN